MSLTQDPEPCFLENPCLLPSGQTYRQSMGFLLGFKSQGRGRK